MAALVTESLKDVKSRWLLREDGDTVLARQEAPQQPVQHTQLARSLRKTLRHCSGSVLEAIEDERMVAALAESSE